MVRRKYTKEFKIEAVKGYVGIADIMVIDIQRTIVMGCYFVSSIFPCVHLVARCLNQGLQKSPV